jgi:hypothetical protein
MRRLYPLVCLLVLMLSAAVEAATLQSQARVHINLEGDTNQDCMVNVLDLAAVGLAYGSGPEDPNWNKDADVYPPGDDGEVDIFDLATVGMNYGSEC